MSNQCLFGILIEQAEQEVNVTVVVRCKAKPSLQGRTLQHFTWAVISKCESVYFSFAVTLSAASQTKVKRPFTASIFGSPRINVFVKLIFTGNTMASLAPRVSLRGGRHDYFAVGALEFRVDAYHRFSFKLITRVICRD